MITEQQLREIFQHWVDAVNARDWDALDRLIDQAVVSDYVGHLPGARNPVRGLLEVKQYSRNVVGAIPGFHSTIEDVFVAGDKAAARFTARRTDPATGKRQRAMVVYICHLEGGKYAEDWEVAGPWEDEA